MSLPRASGPGSRCRGDSRTFEAMFVGSATKLHEFRNRFEQFSVLPDLSRAFYAGIEPRDALYQGGNKTIVDSLAKHEPRIVGRGDWDGTPTVTIETAPIPDGDVERIVRVSVAPEQRLAIVRR